MKRYPFFLVVDDGAFPEAGDGDTRRPVGLDTYDTIVRLGREFGMRIPVCLTLQYLDRRNRSGQASVLPYAEALVERLVESRDAVEIGYHGLVHSLGGRTGEFFEIDTRRSVPEGVQARHIEISARIFEDWGLPFPTLFVPPFHAWEHGVTDRLVAAVGVKWLVSFRKLKMDGQRFAWPARSDHLGFLHRGDIGVYSRETVLDVDQLELARRLIMPSSLRTNWSSRHRLGNPRVHSYMTHIGNFLPGNYSFWCTLLREVTENPRIRIMKDNEEAAHAFRAR